jgi:hypothetical protein
MSPIRQQLRQNLVRRVVDDERQRSASRRAFIRARHPDRGGDPAAGDGRPGW